MDHEVDRFLETMPAGALVLDIGGCWGWHWRRLAATRPDVGILVIDFVRANLVHGRNALGPLINSQLALMQADATALPFGVEGKPAAGFDGVWTVQVFQHIPDFRRACLEAHRVLNPDGRFVNYSLHSTPLNRFLYRLLGRPFHTDGMIKDRFHPSRASDSQRRVIADVFDVAPRDRYTECLFHPDLKFVSAGRAGSWLGKLDARLGDLSWLGLWMGRQRSFEATKALLVATALVDP